MKYGELSLGQIEAIVNKIGGMDAVMSILRGESGVVVYDHLIDLDPDTFFQTRKGLWVSEAFRDRVVAKAKPTMEVPAFKHTPFPRRMNDAEIERMLGDRHIFTETEVSALIADLISRQEGGKKGVLLNNGYANLFYTTSCVVRVGWFAGRREWGVNAYGRDDCRWDADCQVCSPATVEA